MTSLIADAKIEQQAVRDIVARVRQRMTDTDGGGGDDVEDTNSLREIVAMFNKYNGLMGQVAQKYIGDIDFTRLTPTAVLYYL
jgi:chemotaxis regulatin CheY-phosphate phosphatase CheZ